MEELKKGREWKAFQDKWRPDAGSQGPWSMGKSSKTWSMWGRGLVVGLSHHPAVDHVVALGSVLAISLRDSEGSGE